MSNLIKIAKDAKDAALRLAAVPTELKNRALLAVADALEIRKTDIFKANLADLVSAEKLVKVGKMTQSTYNRLKLDENKLRDMIQGVRDVAKLPEPINRKLWAMQLDEDLNLFKVSCPIGVIGVVFEARPDVIAQISALCIKSSNAVILKGGKEAVSTNKVIFEIITSALRTVNFPENAVNQIFTREDVAKMLRLDEYIDLIIPRGGKALVNYVKENTRIPVLGHADGICHIYVDKFANLKKAVDIIVDAKTQYPSACNSVETVLIHKNFNRKEELYSELRNASIDIIYEPESWHKEYSDKKLSLKIVNSLEEAVEHINEFSSGHTESIITENKQNAEVFMNSVDSSGVYHNVSTRFADGYRYGFGAEVGISTNKTHARGPVGLEGLTIYKYKLEGNGHIVKDYAEGIKQFHHRDI